MIADPRELRIQRLLDSGLSLDEALLMTAAIETAESLDCHRQAERAERTFAARAEAQRDEGAARG